MPAKQRGWVRKRKTGWQACWREAERIRTKSPFASKTAAEDWLDDHLDGGAPRRGRDVTFAEHVERFLRVHATTAEASTIRTLRNRLGAYPPGDDDETVTHRRKARPYKTAIEAFGDLTLAELELMSVEIAEWQTTLPPAYRFAVMNALRQVLNAAVRWRLIRANPAKEAGPNPQPHPEEVAFFETLADVDKLAVELGPRFGPIVVLGVETGLRPCEWAALERRDVDRQAAELRVRRTVVDGRMKEYGKTVRSRRSVPLTARALEVIDALPPRLDTPLLFPAAEGGYIDLGNWRAREWRPALEAAGLDRELVPYAMRHTYATFALDAGVSIFELARLMGTSVQMIDVTYGHLVKGSHEHVRAKLEERARREVKAAEAGQA